MVKRVEIDHVKIMNPRKQLRRKNLTSSWRGWTVRDAGKDKQTMVDRVDFLTFHSICFLVSAGFLG